MSGTVLVGDVRSVLPTLPVRARGRGRMQAGFGALTVGAANEEA
jgi:hypothetical protein